MKCHWVSNLADSVSASYQAKTPLLGRFSFLPTNFICPPAQGCICSKYTFQHRPPWLQGYGRKVFVSKPLVRSLSRACPPPGPMDWPPPGPIDCPPPGPIDIPPPGPIDMPPPGPIDCPPPGPIDSQPPGPIDPGIQFRQACAKTFAEQQKTEAISMCLRKIIFISFP